MRASEGEGLRTISVENLMLVLGLMFGLALVFGLMLIHQ